jgi:hypothetical protein
MRRSTDASNAQPSSVVGVAVPEDRPERGDPLVGVVAAGVQRYESDPDPCYPFAAAWASPSMIHFSA